MRRFPTVDYNIGHDCPITRTRNARQVHLTIYICYLQYFWNFQSPVVAVRCCQRWAPVVPSVRPVPSRSRTTRSGRTSATGAAPPYNYQPTHTKGQRGSQKGVSMGAGGMSRTDGAGQRSWSNTHLSIPPLSLSIYTIHIYSNVPLVDDVPVVEDVAWRQGVRGDHGPRPCGGHV